MKMYTFKMMIILYCFVAIKKVKADTFFYVMPNEIRTGCSLRTLNVEINKLQNYTYSKSRRVSVGTDSVGMCNSLKQYLQIKSATKVIVNSKLNEINTPVKYNPCSVGQKICSAIYRKSIVETIQVSINKLVLYNKAEVPGTQKNYIIEWDPRFCPPDHPDCDL